MKECYQQQLRNNKICELFTILLVILRRPFPFNQQIKVTIIPQSRVPCCTADKDAETTKVYERPHNAFPSWRKG